VRRADQCDTPRRRRGVVRRRFAREGRASRGPHRSSRSTRRAFVLDFRFRRQLPEPPLEDAQEPAAVAEGECVHEDSFERHVNRGLGLAVDGHPLLERASADRLRRGNRFTLRLCRALTLPIGRALSHAIPLRWRQILDLAGSPELATGSCLPRAVGLPGRFAWALALLLGRRPLHSTALLLRLSFARWHHGPMLRPCCVRRQSGRPLRAGPRGGRSRDPAHLDAERVERRVRAGLDLCILEALLGRERVLQTARTVALMWPVVWANRGYRGQPRALLGPAKCWKLHDPSKNRLVRLWILSPLRLPVHFGPSCPQRMTKYRSAPGDARASGRTGAFAASAESAWDPIDANRKYVSTRTYDMPTTLQSRLSHLALTFSESVLDVIRSASGQRSARSRARASGSCSGRSGARGRHASSGRSAPPALGGRHRARRRRDRHVAERQSGGAARRADSKEARPPGEGAASPSARGGRIRSSRQVGAPAGDDIFRQRCRQGRGPGQGPLGGWGRSPSSPRRRQEGGRKARPSPGQAWPGGGFGRLSEGSPWAPPASAGGPAPGMVNPAPDWAARRGG